jgi:hypothetical protein
VRFGSFVAMRDLTSYGFQLGRAWVRVLRPRYINRRSWRRIVQVGWEEDDDAQAQDA